MAQITITEALAEYKTIEKRITKKEEFVLQYLLRQKRFEDPLVNEGGVVPALKRETQAINDLRERLILIRQKINEANTSNSVTIKDITRTIAEWIVWKEKVAPSVTKFLGSIRNTIDQHRKQALTKGIRTVTPEEAAQPDDLIVHIDQLKLAKDQELLEEILGILDGQLSLKNATITITLPD